MAKTKRIVVTVDRKMSDDNYGSFGGSVTEEVEIEEGDDLKAERRAARERCVKELGFTLKAVKEATATKAREKE